MKSNDHWKYSTVSFNWLHAPVIRGSSVIKPPQPAGFCPGLLECLHCFNQIQGNNAILHRRAILHYFMVRFKTVAFYAEWLSEQTCADLQEQNTSMSTTTVERLINAASINLKAQSNEILSMLCIYT
jgi:hypothetical protein